MLLASKRQESRPHSVCCQAGESSRQGKLSCCLAVPASRSLSVALQAVARWVAVQQAGHMWVLPAVGLQFEPTHACCLAVLVCHPSLKASRHPLLGERLASRRVYGGLWQASVEDMYLARLLCRQIGIGHTA